MKRTVTVSKETLEEHYRWKIGYYMNKMKSVGLNRAEMIELAKLTRR